MPEKGTLERAERDRRAGKAPSTQAGEFVREELHHIRQGRHGARSTKQAIAIGLSKARRMGVKLPPPKRGTASEETREHAARDIRKASGGEKSVSRTRSRATRRAPGALAIQAKSAASRRSPAARSASAQKAAHTKGPAKRSAAAHKAARTREAHREE